MRHETSSVGSPGAVDARRGLYLHAAMFVLVNAALLAIDAATPGGWWFVWLLFAWGPALAGHAATVAIRHDDEPYRQALRRLGPHARARRRYTRRSTP